MRKYNNEIELSLGHSTSCEEMAQETMQKVLNWLDKTKNEIISGEFDKKRNIKRLRKIKAAIVL